MKLTDLATLALRYPRRIVLGALLFIVVAGVYAAPATWKLPSGGFFDEPGAESTRAEQILDEKFHAGGSSLVFTVTAPGGADSPAARSRGQAIVAALQAFPHARQVISYWTVPPGLNDALVGVDNRTGLVAAQIVGDDTTAPARAGEIAARFAGTENGVTVSAGGQALAFREAQDRSRADLLLMEALAIPFTFLALVWIFGSAVASALPLLVAVFAIAGTLASLWTIHFFTNVSIYAVNLTTAFSLALAIDYTLFIVNRYREELARGGPPRQALLVTMNTAGRTVTYSALTMGLTVSTLIVFPQYMLRSLGYGGVIAVALSLVGALVLAPALIVLMGKRIDALDIRKPIARRLGLTPRNRRPEQQFWHRIALFSMRRAIPVVLVGSAILLLLGAPFLGIKLGYSDDRILPQSAMARQTGDLIRAEFLHQNNTGNIVIVLPDGVTSPGVVAEYASALSRVEDVTQVAAPNGIYAEGRPISPVTFGAARKDNAAYLTVSTTRDPFSEQGKTQLAMLKEVPAPAPALFGGIAQRNLDNVDGITEHVPLVVVLVAVITLVLMFLMTGSVLLPIKALVMNLLSLAAALGVVVWIFQFGNLGALGTAGGDYGTIAFVPPLLACIAYALAIDYEVFVLSRIREEWLRSGRGPGDNERAVAFGMARSGRIVTAAALVMVIVFLGISAGQVLFMRALGVGLTIGVLVDAFLVRTLLIPAFMKLAGGANWWAPGPLARWHDKWGLTEHEAPQSNPEPSSELAETRSAR
ncbi:MMPL family transporter [Nocardia sp. NPDC051832]|uniref:MMPL family transporter n=1 Tax=Nocardia sp. NPDC051832 TaxID=3155673 RepID=UPI003429971A